MSKSLFGNIELNQEQKDILEDVIRFMGEINEMAKMDGVDPEIVTLSCMSLFVSSVEKFYKSDSEDDNEIARGYVVGILHELSTILDGVDDPLLQLGITNVDDDQGGVMFG
ncbi:MAG: hypothetical protein KAJ06_01535 [Gammaproteobacteria bacterium]|nr:hypothetical protein [Thermodesulfovibrionia bacterium]MCK5479789.1 hypothetical protein [Gammaproteobacteria bacterium]